MTASFTIGRVGLDVNLEHVATMEMTQGRYRLALTGTLRASTLVDAKALRDQLLGYIDNPDEPFVPVTWSEDSSINGFYEVNAVQVTYLTMSLTTFLFRFSATITRTLGQQLDVTQAGTIRTNDASINAGTMLDVFTIPALSGAKAHYIDQQSLPNTVTRETLVSERGSNSLYRDSCAGLLVAKTFRVEPDYYYHGATKLEVSYDSGSTWRVWTGLGELPNSDYWRLSNDLFRIYPASTGANNTKLTLSAVTAFSGTATFETIGVEWAWGDGSGSQPVTVAALAGGNYQVIGGNVLRNGPTVVAVRLFVVDTTGATITPFMSIDVTLRRGAHFAEFYTLREYRVATSWSATEIRHSTAATAGTSLTGGIRATSNDANGNRLVLGATVNTTKDTTNTRIKTEVNVTSSHRYIDAYFMAGIEVNGSSATGAATAQNMVNTWMNANVKALRAVRI